MPLPDRIYNLAKGHLDKALERWEEIDTKAQQEIDSVLMNSSGSDTPSAWDRALAKINASNAAKELEPAGGQIDMRPPIGDADLEAFKQELIKRGEYADKPPIATQATPTEMNTVAGAYKVLGVAPGSDWAIVRDTYQKLKERAAPERFPEGSAEQSAARDIQRRIDAAFMILTNSLAPSSERFDRLEF